MARPEQVVHSRFASSAAHVRYLVAGVRNDSKAHRSVGLVRRLHCAAPMQKKDAKKLKVKIGKKSVRTLSDKELGQVSGGKCTVSPPPTLDC